MKLQEFKKLASEKGINYNNFSEASLPLLIVEQPGWHPEDGAFIVSLEDVIEMGKDDEGRMYILTVDHINWAKKDIENGDKTPLDELKYDYAYILRDYDPEITLITN